MPALDIRISSSADDVEESAAGSVNFTSSDLELVDDASKPDQTIGLRFTGLGIPQGAIITKAYIQFQVDEVSTGTAALQIHGVDVDNAAAFASRAFDVSARAATSATVAWQPAAWTTVGQAGLDQRTADISTVIQEIVNRTGWAANNALALVITGSGKRVAESFDGSAAAAPLLHIEYELPPTSAPVAFANPPDANGAANSLAETAAAGTLVGITAVARDPDAGDTVSYGINDARFAIDASGVVTRSGVGTLDYEMAPSVTVTVTATSSDRSSATQAFTIDLVNINEPVAFANPADANPAANSILANAAAGTMVGITAVARDPDLGATVGYSLDDARFAIAANGVITRSGLGTLDPVGEPTITLTVTATSSDASTATQAFTLNVASVQQTPTVINARISSSVDDVEERASGSVNFTSTDLELVDDGATQPDQTIGLRFTGLGIPQGAIITKAYIQFQVDEVSTGTTALQIHGVDVDNAAVFANRAFDVSSRAATSATVAWQPAPWTTVGQAGLDQRTADISTVIQEIVNRTGWAANNALALVITGSGQRVAEAFDGAAGAAPLLHVEFLPPGPPSAPVAFANPPDVNGAANSLAETAAAGTLVGITAVARDPDAGDTVSYGINDARFAIDASGVVTRSGVGTLDYETAPSVTVTVTATSSDRSTATQAFTIDLVNVNEPVAFANPADANPAANSILANAAAGTLVGITAVARDPDLGATVGYSLNDARFAIAANGVITRSAVGTLDPVGEPTITLTVTATSSDASTATRDYTLSVGGGQQTANVIRFAVFGDYGDTETSGEKAVAALVDSWNVDFILTVGDNAYGSLPFDNAVGQHYSDYIGNYKGSYGTGSAINRFFPTLGNHEYEDSSAGPNGSLSVYLNYFTLPDNERYYDFQAGQVHLFGVNSNSQEPDGASASSVQGQWLRNALASSDATYNVVYFHHTPYNGSGGDNDMRWPFEAWGADAVFAGHKHNFDRVQRDDNLDGVSLPYVTTGLGGAGTSPPNAGASLVTVSDSGMLIEFYTVDGVLRDTYTVAAPPGGNPLFVNGNDVLNGTAAADYLWGLNGNDTLKGLAGNDMLIGGAGDDLFVFAAGSGQDTIADFMPGAGTADRLDLRAFGIDTASEFQRVAFDQGPDLVLDLGSGNRITFLGIHVQQFHDTDFLA